MSFYESATAQNTTPSPQHSHYHRYKDPRTLQSRLELKISFLIQPALPWIRPRKVEPHGDDGELYAKTFRAGRQTRPDVKE
jgi:hypothetical protein